MKPILYIVVPCYNEQEVLTITGSMFADKIIGLVKNEMFSAESKVVFVNDGSKDNTWEIICQMAKADSRIEGITLSRNRGHQNAVLAGLLP